jgi:hypothetical protein
VSCLDSFVVHGISDTEGLLIGLELSTFTCLFTVTYHIQMEGNRDAGKAGPLENLCLHAAGTSCVATAVDCVC